MKKAIRFFLIFLIVAGIGFVGCKIVKNIGSDKDNQDKTETAVKENSKSEEAPLPVKVVKIRKGDLPLRLRVSAVTEVRQKAAIKAEISGKVAEVRKKIGDRVKKGELIIRIDDKEMKLALKKAEAERLQALSKYIVNTEGFNSYISSEKKKGINEKKSAYEKALKLYKEGKITEKELHAAEDELLKAMIESGAMREQVQKVVLGLTQAELNLTKARLDYERTRIKAPFSGIISKLDVSEGETVSAGTELFKIINLNSIYLKAFVLETEASKIREGMRVRIKFVGFPGKVFYGKIFAISPELSEKEETLPVYISLKNPGYLRAGMRAEAEIEYKILKDVIIVPRKAILVRSERPLVFVVENNIALWRYIEMGKQNSEDVEIKSGVEEGELVIVEGQLTLAHQSKVRIVK